MKNEIRVDTIDLNTGNNLDAQLKPGWLRQKPDPAYRLAIFFEGKVVHASVKQSAMTAQNIHEMLKDMAEAVKVHIIDKPGMP